jgi:hypothetical protein
MVEDKLVEIGDEVLGSIKKSLMNLDAVAFSVVSMMLIRFIREELDRRIVLEDMKEELELKLDNLNN